MPKVWNKYYKNAPADAVYVGRPSIYGNPFTHDAAVYKKSLLSRSPLILVKTREEAVGRFRQLIEDRPALKAAIQRELRGKDLVCWCAPASCHGDVLLEVANEEPARQEAA